MTEFLSFSFTLVLAFLAGILTLLSPCILPVAPLTIASAHQAHRFGLFALVGGLCVSFTTIGLSLAMVGSVIGLDANGLRILGGALFVLFGLILMVSHLEGPFKQSLSVIGDLASNLLAKLTPEGLGGQFLIGLLLGLVWVPCSGPTLGAASLLAAQGKNLAQTASVFFVFALGASLPLLVIARLSRHFLQKKRDQMMRFAQRGRFMLGLVMLIMGLLLLSGLLSLIEGLLVSILPIEWFEFTTKI